MTDEAPKLDAPPVVPDQIGPPTDFDARVLAESMRLREQFEATRDDQERANVAKQTWDRLVLGDILTAMRGESPVDTPSGYKQFAHPLIQGLHQSAMLARLGHQANGALADPELGWDQIRKEWDENVAKPFQAQNANIPDEPGQSPQQQMAIAMQRTPVEVDPNWIADLRQRMTKLNARMLELSDGKVNIWNHPKTQHIASWMNREAEPGRAGYMVAGEQDLGVQGAILEYGVEPALDLTTGLLDMPVKVAQGAYGLVGEMVQGITGGAVGWSAPTSFIETEDGRIVPNAERLPGALEMFQGLRAAALGQDIAKQMAKWNADREWQKAQNSGIGTLLQGSALVGGSIIGLAPTVRAGQAIEQTMNRGLAILGAGGKVSAGTKATARMGKVLGTMTGAAGQGIAMGIQDGLISGRPEGLMQAFGHGMEAGLVMFAIGKAGRGVERLANSRKNMPEKLAAAFGVFTEAGLFTGVELSEMQGGIWNFIRDPSRATWDAWHQIAAKNILGIFLARGAGLRLGGEVSRERQAMAGAAEGRADLAERLLRAREQTEPGEPLVSRETEALGERVGVSEPGKPLEARKEPPRREELLSEEELEALGLPRAKPAEKPTEAPAEELPPAMAEQIARQEAAAKAGKPEDLLSELQAAAKRGDEAEVDRLADILNQHPEAQRPDIQAPLMETMRQFEERLAEGAPERVEGMRERPTEEPARPAREPEPPPPEAERPLPRREPRKPPDWMERIPEELRREVEREQVDPEDLIRLAEARRRTERGDIEAAMELRELELEVQRKRYREAVSEAEKLEEELGQAREKVDFAEEDQPGWIGSVRAMEELRITEAQPGVEPVREVDIYNKMTGYRGDPIRTVQRRGMLTAAVGKLGRSIKGFFERNKDLIRYRVDNDVLAIRAHEFSHSVQRHAEGFERRLTTDRARNEAAEMLEGYAGLRKKEVNVELDPETVFAEAFAEYHARVILGEPGMAQKFPALTNEFAHVMAANPRVARQFQEVVALAARYRAQGAGERLRQMIFFGDDPVTPEQRAARIAAEGTMWEQLVTRADEFFVDDLAFAKKAQAEFARRIGQGKGDIPLAQDYIRTAEALRYTEAAVAADFLENGVLIGKTRSKALRKALKQLDTVEAKRAFGAYLVGRRMLEMQWKGMPTGMTREGVLRGMAENAELIGGKDAAEAMAKTVKDAFDSLLMWAANEGLLPFNEAKTLIESWDTYVPMIRRLQRSESLRTGTPKSGGGLKKMRGSVEEVEDVFEAMQQVTVSIVRAAHQAKVLNALYERARGGAVAAEVEILKPHQIPKQYTIDEVLRAIENQFQRPGDKQQELESSLETLREALGDEAAAMLTLFRPEFRPPNQKPILLHRLPNGKKVWMQVDRTIFEGLQTVQHPGASSKAVAAMQRISETFRFLKVPTQVVRWFATQTNLEFAARNTLRDAILFPGYSKVSRAKLVPYSGLAYWGANFGRLLQASEPKGLPMKTLKGLLKATGADNPGELTSLAYSWWTAMGGEGLSYRARSLAEMRGGELVLPKGARVPERVTFRGMIERARDAVEKHIGELVDVGEQSLRFGEFRSVFDRALKQGANESQAALEALEAAKEVMINYTRHSLVGRQLNSIVPYWNASIQGKRKVFRAFFGLDGADPAKAAWINAASSLGVMSGLTYLLWGQEDWFKDLAPWQRFTSWHIGPNIEIPKPHGIGPLFTAAFDALFAEEKMTPGESMKGVLDDWLFDQLALPAFMLPIVESTVNFSMFKGRPLVPDWMQRSRIPPDQFNSYTKAWAKWVSRTVWDAFGYSWSPIKIENAINQSLGNMPNRLERSIAGLGQALGFELAPDRNTLLDQIPVVSSFFRHHPHRAGITRNRFEDLFRELEQKSGSEVATDEERVLLQQARQIKSRMQDVDRLYRMDAMSNEQRDRLLYELTLPLMVRARQR